MKMQELKERSSAHRALLKKENASVVYPPLILNPAQLINPGEIRTHHSESPLTYRAISDVKSS
jgi:hypothetical protein